MTEDSRIPLEKGKAVNPLEDWELKKHPKMCQLQRWSLAGRSPSLNSRMIKGSCFTMRHAENQPLCPNG
ncbi:hypothetical protein VP01_662g10 [Puccinia sorghi]|uniref:Uncharacterized protein n=1 Tax=Puccinia sorghi TaxID=27349 RepID=A0A0L6UF74_9BASI|nr:hypothetical protein VP01_662g10 [Puccinia sorghi]